MRTLCAAVLLALLAPCVALPVPANAAPAQALAKKKGKRRLKVRKIRPRSGRTFVRLDATIRIKFSRPVDPESISTETVILRRLLGDAILFESSFTKKGRRLVITPVGPLDPGTDYEVVIDVGVRSTDGRQLASPKRSIFFTDPSVQPLRYLHPEQFSEVASRMIEGRAAHSETTLHDGRVLLAGGQRDFAGVTGSADTFDPDTDTFSAVPATMVYPRSFHVSVPFHGGALQVGGWSGVTSLAETEFFDPAFDRFQDLGPMNEERDFVAAVALEDGDPLVVGGLSYAPGGASYSKTAEVYESGTGWRYTHGEMSEARAGHALTLLTDGRVLVTGGQPPGSTALPRAEIFDPRTERFTLVESPALERRQMHTATLLPNSGWVLIADGGVGRVALFDPVNERFFDAGGATFVRRTRATASLLGGDRVLFAGGFDTQGDEQLILSGMDLFLPGQGGIGRMVHASVVFPVPRAGHTATRLPGGRVLFTGGFGSASDQSLNTGILFKPVE